MNAEELRREIKKLIRQVGWTQAEAARRVWRDLNEVDDEDELRRYVEIFKKRLGRSTTSLEHLKTIYDVLCRQPEINKLRTIKPTFLPGASLPPALLSEMRSISRTLDREIELALERDMEDEP